MNTADKVREASTRMLLEAQQVSHLLMDDGFKIIMERINQSVDEAKENVLKSETFEDFRYRRGFLEGLKVLQREIDTIISKGKNKH